jgi:hypothetical protein
MRSLSMAICAAILISGAKFMFKANLPISGWVCLGFGVLMCVQLARSR